MDDLRGSDAETNAEIIQNIVSGQEKGPKKDMVVINAAAAIIVADIACDFASAIKVAEGTIAEGKALECLEKLVEISNQN